jgi:hypothetical protein
MAPAFSSTKQAAAFSLLLLVLLLLPAVFKKNWLPPREEIYSSLKWGSGPFPFLQQQIFEEKGDIDIAFIGSSHIWCGIETPYVQKELSKKLERQAVVRSICWGGAGFDALYFFSKDLLEHRKVHLLVFYDEFVGRRGPQLLSVRWFRFGENAEELAGLPVEAKVPFYFAAILGMPRNLLSLIRTNLLTNVFPERKTSLETIFRTPNPAARLGSLAPQIGFNPDPNALNLNFVDYTPQLKAQPSDVCIYSPASKEAFQFSGPPTTPWQLAFARKFAQLARNHQAKLVILHFPTTDELKAAKIEEREFWPSVLGTDVTMLGIPSATLFDGMTDDNILKLFYNTGHLNKNGQELFTPLITPALLKIYDSQTNR